MPEIFRSDSVLRGEGQCVATALPHFAFMAWVHLRADGTLIVFREFLHVSKRPDDTEASWCMETGGDAQLDGFITVHCTPCVCSAQPE